MHASGSVSGPVYRLRRSRPFLSQPERSSSLIVDVDQLEAKRDDSYNQPTAQIELFIFPEGGVALRKRVHDEK